MSNKKGSKDTGNKEHHLRSANNHTMADSDVTTSSLPTALPQETLPQETHVPDIIERFQATLIENNARLAEIIAQAIEKAMISRQPILSQHRPPPSNSSSSATLFAGSTDTFPSLQPRLTLSNSPTLATFQQTSEHTAFAGLHDDSSPSILITLYLRSASTGKITTFHTTIENDDADSDDQEQKPELLLTLPSFLHPVPSSTNDITDIHTWIRDYLHQHLHLVLPESYSPITFYDKPFSPTPRMKDSLLTEISFENIQHMGFIIDYDLTSPTEASLDFELLTYDIASLQSMQRNTPERLLNHHLNLLEAFTSATKDFRRSSKPSTDKPTKSTPTPLEEKQKRHLLTATLQSPQRDYIVEDLSCLSHISSLINIAPTLDKNQHHPRQPWRFPQLTNISIHHIDPYFHNALAHAQTHRQTPPWDSISPEVKQMILSHPTNRNESSHPTLFLDDMLNSDKLPQLINILTDMAKPETPSDFLQAYSQRVHFPDSTITDTNHELHLLLANLQIFLSNTYTFWSSYTNKRQNKPPMNAKPHGFLDVMYKKMPQVIFLVAIVQQPLDPGIKLPTLLDVIWHIQHRVNEVIRKNLVTQTALQSALPPPPPVSIPLLQRFPLYTGSTTPRTPTTTPTATSPRTDTKHPPYDPNKQRPDFNKPTYQQRSQPSQPY